MTVTRVSKGRKILLYMRPGRKHTRVHFIEQYTKTKVVGARAWGDRFVGR